MKSKVYCLASPKGGSGKTVLCASFAAFMTQLGKKVLIVDVDAATHGLTLLYLSELNAHKEGLSEAGNSNVAQGFFDDGSCSLSRDTILLPNGVYFLPATYSFAITDRIDCTDLKTSLQTILASGQDIFDYVLLDAQAGTDEVSRIAMSQDVSNEVVIVSEYDPLSAAGVERMKAVLREDLIYARTWVLLNKMLPDFVSTFSAFFEVNKYLTPIPWDADVVRAYARRRLPLDLDYGNQFTLAVMQSLKRLLGDDVAIEIDSWAEDRASGIRAPIEQQYLDTERSLESLIRHRGWTSRYRYMKKFRAMILLIGMTSAVATALWAGTSVFGAQLLLSKPFYITATTLTASIIISLIYLYINDTVFKDVSTDVEDARLERQISKLEDTLRKLEVLRKADLQSLVKENVRNTIDTIGI